MLAVQTTSTTEANPQNPVSDIVNRVLQGIWQLQIGCLHHCAHTWQSQQAAQTDAEQVHGSTSIPSGTTASTTINAASQTIWQLQIGCLFWCYDTVEQQTATTQPDTAVIAPSPPTAPVEPTATDETPSDPGALAPPQATIPSQETAAAATTHEAITGNTHKKPGHRQLVLLAGVAIASITFWSRRSRGP